MTLPIKVDQPSPFLKGCIVFKFCIKKKIFYQFLLMGI